MPRKGTYVDNAMNRSLGRVGMAYGSAVVSSSTSRSGGSGGASGYGYSSYSSSSAYSPRTYVDNASNRSLGRVGRPVGSHVVSRDGSVTLSSGASRTSSSSSKVYVDNSLNRSLGRVGQPHGTCVQHKDGSVTRSHDTSTSSSSTKTYVDNALNRSLGRVGQPHGACVQHRDGSVTRSSDISTRSTSSSATKTYVDNPQNRKLGRVGLPLGACVQHRDGSITRSSSHSSDVTPKTYRDNAYNRKHGQVGKPLGSHVIPSDSSSATSPSAAAKAPRKKRPNPTKVLLSENDLDEILTMLRQIAIKDADHQASLALAQYTLQRSEIEENWGKSGIYSSTDHSVVSAKEIIPLEDISLDKNVIGEGGFGRVYAGLWKGTPIAYKKLITQLITNKKKQQLVNEIRIFSRLDHRNIVKMFGVVVEPNNIGIVMEYLSMTLFHALFIEDVEFSYTDKKRIITEVMSAVSYLHSQNIAHCDIKCQNVLLDSKRVAKVCDFGLSAIKNSSTSTTTASAAPGQGTPRYSAPEVLRGELLKLPGRKMADIYSLTLVIYQVLCVEEPFEELNYPQLVAHVGRGGRRPELDATLTQPVKDLLTRGWVEAAIHRPSIAELTQAWSKIVKLFL